MSSTVLPCLHTHTQFGCCCALHLLPEWLIFIYLFRIFGADMNKKKLLNFRCFSPKYASFGSLLPWFRLYTYNYPVYFLCLRVFNLLWAILLMLYQVIGCEIQTAANHTHTHQTNAIQSSWVKVWCLSIFRFFLLVFLYSRFICACLCAILSNSSLSLSLTVNEFKNQSILARRIYSFLFPQHVFIDWPHTNKYRTDPSNRRPKRCFGKSIPWGGRR